MFGLLAALVGLFGSSGPPPVSAQTETGICDRTERVQDAILGMLYGVDDCADVTGSHLAGITLGMRIRNGSYDRQALSLESGDFAGLVNIEGLAIYNHTMDALPEDIFDGLGSLESLDLSNNEITALPEGVFDGLGSLESLDLSNNEITALPEGVFDGLGSLESLDLSNNEIAALPEDVFDGLGRLDHLELWSNRINALPEDVFEGLGNLTYLRLSFNQLSALPDDVFDDLGNLAYLDVQGNQLGALPEDVFNGAGSLKRLDLSYNEIAALPEDVFEGLGNLTLLMLDSNRLASPPEDVFDGLDSLMHLYLSHNRIHTLPEDVFEGLGNLTYLYLHNNPGTPFTLTADLERQGDNAVLVKVAEAVPFDMAVTLSATGGTLSAASVTIKGGTAGSEAVTATRSGDGPLTVSVVWAVFQAGYYSGVRTGLGEPLILGDAAGGNRPATGTPAISGAVQVGETLTADTSGIADEDGLDNVSYSYQWLSSRDTETDGATGSTYTLQATDLGKIIKVRVTFTDDVGNEETLTSAATDTVEARPNSPATGAPTISGTAQVGETLTADTSGISDIDGLDNLTYSYQWLTSRDTQIAGAISSTYTLAEADAGKAIKVRVSFTDDAGNAEILTSAATAAVAARPNSAAAGAPTISGTAQVGQMLTASTSGVSDTDGLANATFTYQWISNDGSADSDISGATDATYTLVKADEGKTIKVRVSFTDDAGNQETLTSAATTEVAARPNSPATGAPAISGTAQVGEDADSRHVRHRRRRRTERRELQLPMAFEPGHGNPGRDGRSLRPGLRRRGKDDQGAGVLHRRQGTPGDADERGYRSGGCCASSADCKHPRRAGLTRQAERVQLRAAVQRELWAQLQDPPGPWVHGDGGLGNRRAPPGPAQQHPVGDQCQAGRQRGRHDPAPGHHGLCDPGSHLHGGRQDAVHPGGTHRQQAQQRRCRCADGQRDGAGRTDADRVRLRHHRQRRAEQRDFFLPVAVQRLRHLWWDQFHIHAG